VADRIAAPAARTPFGTARRAAHRYRRRDRSDHGSDRLGASLHPGRPPTITLRFSRNLAEGNRAGLQRRRTRRGVHQLPVDLVPRAPPPTSAATPCCGATSRRLRQGSSRRWVTLRLARDTLGDRRLALVAVGLLVSFHSFAIYLTGGLETQWQTALVTLVVWLLSPIANGSASPMHLGSAPPGGRITRGGAGLPDALGFDRDPGRNPCRGDVDRTSQRRAGSAAVRHAVAACGGARRAVGYLEGRLLRRDPPEHLPRQTDADPLGARARRDVRRDLPGRHVAVRRDPDHSARVGGSPAADRPFDPCCSSPGRGWPICSTSAPTSWSSGSWCRSCRSPRCSRPAPSRTCPTAANSPPSRSCSSARQRSGCSSPACWASRALAG
jgi:hypothetical protein